MYSACLRVFVGVVLILLAAGAGQARELRVCADPNNLPFSNERGEGFENKLAELIAEELQAKLIYLWRAQRRGFLRETIKAGLCDIVPGIMAGMATLLTTTPYYRSTYVFVRRIGEPQIASLDDPLLRNLRIGVQLIGDDGANTPPAHALSKRGITGNVRGYMIYGDYAKPNPPARIVEAVASGEIDVAIAWGPMAGYFATRESVPLAIGPVSPQADGPRLPMVFDIAVGVDRENRALWDEINAVLNRRRADVNALLASYGVPRVDTPGQHAGTTP
jgi:mxaJ protein